MMNEWSDKKISYKNRFFFLSDYFWKIIWGKNRKGNDRNFLKKCLILNF